MKKLDRQQMKSLRGGLEEGGGGFGCLEQSSCSLVVNNGGTYTTYYGNCEWTVNNCKCATSYGNYETSSGSFACQHTP